MSISAVSSSAPSNHAYRQPADDSATVSSSTLNTIAAAQASQNQNPSGLTSASTTTGQSSSSISAISDSQASSPFGQSIRPDLSGLNTPVNQLSSSSNTGRDNGQLNTNSSAATSNAAPPPPPPSQNAQNGTAGAGFSFGSSTTQTNSASTYNVASDLSGLNATSRANAASNAQATNDTQASQAGGGDNTPSLGQQSPPPINFFDKLSSAASSGASNSFTSTASTPTNPPSATDQYAANNATPDRTNGGNGSTSANVVAQNPSQPTIDALNDAYVV